LDRMILAAIYVIRNFYNHNSGLDFA